MFKERDFDSTLIGNNYLLLSLAIAKLSEKEKVLVIENRNKKNSFKGPLYLTDIEVTLLRKIGELKNIKPLINIDNFLLKSEDVFCIGNKRISLGKESSGNFNELFKKGILPLPQFENRDSELDFIKNYSSIDFSSMIELLCDSYLKKETKENLNFAKKLPHEFKNLYQLITSTFTKINDEDTISFLYLYQGAIFKKPKIEIYEKELPLFALSLFSKRYLVNEKSLMDELRSLFVEQGGVLKDTEISDWSLKTKEPLRLELKSFEGIVYPKKIIFSDFLDESIPFNFKKNLKNYNAIKISTKTIEFPNTFHDKRFLFSSNEKMGTEIPLSFFEFGKESSFAIVFYPNDTGVKSEFYFKKAKEIFIEESKKIYPLIKDSDIANLSAEEVNDFIFPRHYDSYYQENEAKGQDIFLRDESGSLKNIYYLGPSSAHSFGGISIIRDLWGFLS